MRSCGGQTFNIRRNRCQREIDEKIYKQPVKRALRRTVAGSRIDILSRDGPPPRHGTAVAPRASASRHFVPKNETETATATATATANLLPLSCRELLFRIPTESQRRDQVEKSIGRHYRSRTTTTTVATITTILSLPRRFYVKHVFQHVEQMLILQIPSSKCLHS